MQHNHDTLTPPPDDLGPSVKITREEACRMFGVNMCVWKNWVRQGRVHCGQWENSPGAKRKVYAVEDLRRLREEMFGEDKLYKDSKGHYHVPANYVRRAEALRMFCVERITWVRWEREGRIPQGSRVGGGPKIYALADITRMLAEFGRLAPPYPDPQRPGCYRVPLFGRDIQRREAIIDADALSLVEGGHCTLAGVGEGMFVCFCPNDQREANPLRRFIMGVTESKLQVGHVNGDPLDCRRENLFVRTVTHRVAGARKREMTQGKPCSSQFKGVYWDSWAKRWRASITVDGVNLRLGRFDDEAAAAEAYDEAARAAWGQYARLNFPEDALTRRGVR